jgi:hypothetical protein
MGDALQTGPNGRLEVTFVDDTRLTLGDNAKVVIDRYVYNNDRCCWRCPELHISGLPQRYQLPSRKRISAYYRWEATTGTPIAAGTAIVAPLVGFMVSTSTNDNGASP